MHGDTRYHHGAHSVYLLQYHIIWCPKFRYAVLNDARAERLKAILMWICGKYGYIVKALEVMPDHIHIFVDAPQTVAPCDIVRTLKSISAKQMLKDFPDLRRFYSRCGVLWSSGDYIASVGHVSAEAITRYIEEQKEHERKECQRTSTRKQS